MAEIKAQRNRCEMGKNMKERALRIVLVAVGLLFCAAIYPLGLFWRQEPALAMMLSLYVTLGVFLLNAVRDPSANEKRYGIKQATSALIRRAK
jgi:NADH:ubiquinone oxidoreductase subunit 5 (subunit L)/multisubunit Na+/H+ antiporter MnhA subunit